MPEIFVSEQLYAHLLDASGEEDLDATMWKMVYHFQRGNSPGD